MTSQYWFQWATELSKPGITRFCKVQRAGTQQGKRARATAHEHKLDILFS
jgi:hypothetical protein